MHPWSPGIVSRSFEHALEAARQQYATHGPLLAQAIRLRDAASSLRQSAPRLGREAFEREAGNAHLSRGDRPAWWYSNAAVGTARDEEGA